MERSSSKAVTWAHLSEDDMRAVRGGRIAMVFQEPMTALSPLMKVGRQIDEVLEIHTDLAPAQRRERVLALLRDVHLPEPERLIDSFPHQLSGGQRQRVVIAMALALEPALIIADEPTTALDVTTQAQILHLMKELQRSHGTAVLFITHDFGVVAEIADRVIVMRHGEIVETGTTRQVLGDPQADYSKTLIAAVPGSRPGNAAPGRRKAQTSRRCWRSSSCRRLTGVREGCFHATSAPFLRCRASASP
jgi:peptide/nickel transport system ATP-binding protein